MKQKFAVFDIDGTVIRWQLYHAIVNELIHFGALSEQVGNDIKEARMTWKKREYSESFRAYEKVLVQAYHDGFANLKVEDFNRAVDAVFGEYKDQVYTYSRNMIRDLKEQGYCLLAISGSQQEIIIKLAEYYGFDDAIGQVYEQKEGRFTGKHTAPMHHKDVVLQKLIAKHNLTIGGSIAVGDSEGDIPMLAMVEQPIAFNPSKGLFEEAKKQGWKVVIERKNVTYEIEPRDGSYVLA
jgi:HAD superfamily hydrolase (TIGR01490 family)